MTASEERVVVEGRARTSLLFAMLTVDKRVLGRHVSAQRLVIDTDDGRAVEVALDAGATVFAPLASETAPWGDLESRDAAATFRATGPGPHVAATLATATIVEGTRVLASGVSLDEGLAGGGLRDASTRVVTKVRATQLTFGDAALAAAAAATARAATALRSP